MALSVKTTQLQGQNTFIADLVAAADGDTGELLINHGLVSGGAPLIAYVIPTIATTLAANPAFCITTLPNTTQVGVTKALGGVGSAGGVPGTTVIGRLVVTRPHSITS